MKEEDLNVLLRLAIQRGDWPVELDDSAVDTWLTRDMAGVPPAVPSRIERLVKARLQENVLRESAASIGEVITPLGRLIFAIRTKAALSRTALSELLGKSEEYVAKIEESQDAVPEVSAEEFVGLMQLLRLTVSKVSETLNRTIDSRELPGNLSWRDALATGLSSNRDEALSFRKVSRSPAPAGEREAAERWLSGVQAELSKRNLTDLNE